VSVDWASSGCDVIAEDAVAMAMAATREAVMPIIPFM
jgi:hypothetical protein